MLVVTPSVIVAAASSALVLTVASQCARNMMQTARIASASVVSQTLPGGATSSKTQSSALRDLFEGSDSIADRLREMNRADLLRVFAESRAPTPEELDEITGNSSDSGSGSDSSGEWDGVLLDNNSKIMDLSSNLMTHALFGGIALPWRLVSPGRTARGRWNGKAFSKPHSHATTTAMASSTSTSPGTTTTATTKGRGINRFVPITSTTTTATATAATESTAATASVASCFTRHDFDYSIEDSVLVPGTKSLRLSYAKYQSLPISLWHSMNDELRVVELPADGDSGGGVGDGSDNDCKREVSFLIGMGWMGWSGGPLNCSPFLLERRRSSSPSLSLSLSSQTAEQ